MSLERRSFLRTAERPPAPSDRGDISSKIPPDPFFDPVIQQIVMEKKSFSTLPGNEGELQRRRLLSNFSRHLLVREVSRPRRDHVGSRFGELGKEGDFGIAVGGIERIGSRRF